MIGIGIIFVLLIIAAVLFSDSEKCPECKSDMFLNSYDHYQCSNKNCNYYSKDKWKTESSDKETSNQ